MSPSLNSPSDYINDLKDALLDNAALRDGLTDDEAQPLIDWALRQANYVGPTIENEEDAEFKQTNLNRLVLYITRFTTRRLDDKDTEWVNKQLERLSEFSQNIGGKSLSEDVKTQLADHSNLSNADVLTILTNAFDQAEMPTQPMPKAEPEPPTDTAINPMALWGGPKPDTADKTTEDVANDVQENLNAMQGSNTESRSGFLSNLSAAVKKHLTDIEDDETI